MSSAENFTQSAKHKGLNSAQTIISYFYADTSFYPKILIYHCRPIHYVTSSPYHTSPKISTDQDDFVFYVPLTLFKLYRDNGRAIMKGSMQ